MTAPAQPRPPRQEPCNHCKEPVIWVLSAVKRLRMPLDARPSRDRGNVQVHVERGQHIGYVIGKKSQATAMRAAGVPLHVFHSDSCTHASLWAKGGRGRGEA